MLVSYCDAYDAESMTTEPTTPDPQLWEGFLDGLRQAAREAAPADTSATTGLRGIDSPGNCPSTPLIARHSATLANADDVHDSAMAIAAHECPSSHGPWNRLVIGCKIYARAHQAPASGWEHEARQWLRPPPTSPYGPASTYGPAPGPNDGAQQPGFGYPGQGSTAIPDVVDHAMHIGTYLGAAAAGGIVGNRADAGLVAAMKRMIGALRGRLPGGRTRFIPPPVSREQAIEHACHAVAVQGYMGSSLITLSTDQEDDCWLIHCRALHPSRGEDWIRVRVPFNDPATSTVLIMNQEPR
jgi:hypothetical protein